MLVCFQFFTLTVKAQTGKRIAAELHEESVTMMYRPNQFNNQRKTPAYRYHVLERTTGTTITTVQVNVDSSGNNIINDAANEPSIAVNPVDPNKISIGWRQFDDISSNFRQAGWSFSADAGTTWTFPGCIESGWFRSDPVLDYDNAGNFFYNSLTNDPVFQCKVFKSTDGGASWDLGTDASGGDKQWMVIDRNGGVADGFIYSAWSSFANSCSTETFTRSTNFNASYEPCTVVDGDPHFGTMAIDRAGNVYVGGWDFNNNIGLMAKSTNADVAGSTVQWQAVPVDMGGFIASGQVNPAGLIGQINIEVDNSGTATDGNVYMMAALGDPSGTSSDVMFTRSTDGGMTWSLPVIINDDVNFAWQWLGTLSVAPNGRLDAVWLDTRDGNGSDSSALYYSYSQDGGLTWSVNEKLSELFDPHVGYPQQDKMGDYFDMISENDGAHLAWAGTFNGEQDVYYSYIQPNLATFIPTTPKMNVSLSPNPSTDHVMIKGLSLGAEVSITSLTGTRCYSFEAKSDIERVDLSAMSSGIYIVSILIPDGTRIMRKLVKN